MTSSRYARRRAGLLVALVVLAALVLLASRLLGGSGTAHVSPHGASAARTSAAHGALAPAGASPGSAAPPAPAPPPPPPPPPLVVTPPPSPGRGWRVAARVHGVPAAWIAQRGPATLMRFDQRLVHLTLHAGSLDGGATGWRYGDRISPREVHHVVAAFNGGFKLSYASVGFLAGGRVAATLKDGLASVVTYADGLSDVGAWHAGVPGTRAPVYSVLQNQRLLVDGGVPAANADSCVIACWGETIGSVTATARSGLGVTSHGQLVWAAGESLTPGALADALVGAHALRAIELDINPFWVAGYLYVHGHGGPTPVPVVPGQHGIAGELLAPYTRDFFAVVANG